MSREDRINELIGETPAKTPAAVRGQPERAAKEVRTRTRGVFNGMNKKLDVLAEIPGYHMYWFNDDKGRVELAQQGGWEFVGPDEAVLPETTRVLQTNSAVDSKVRRIVGSNEQGDAMYAYLMKLKNEWWEEDQADRINKNTSSMESLIRDNGVHDGISDGNHRYIPNGRKQALEIRRGSR